MPVTVLADRAALMRAAADEIVGLARSAIASRGRFTWALAGGSTPEQLYTLLASPELAARVDWGHVHFFWGDERCVPPDHADSNYRMARASLLDVVKPPEANVHRMSGELAPALAAARYEEELGRCFERAVGDGFPELDLVLLGLGADGHTASLFPGTRALTLSRRWVVDNYVRQLRASRLTFTVPLINAARRVLFLVAGQDKAARVQEVLSRDAAAKALPAQLIRPRGADPEWLVDSGAGSLLGGSP